jgi:uncharacterized protein (DUF2384 family)
MRIHQPTTGDIILSQAQLNGMKKSDLIRRTGISKTTFNRRIRTDTWTVPEIRAIDRLVHFTPEQCAEILKNK